MSLDKRSEIITNGYLDINKHPLKEEISKLRNCQSELLSEKCDSIAKMLEITENIISINDIINNKIILMLPERGDMSKFSSFQELLDIHPGDGISRIRYTFDFEVINNKLNTFNIDFFDNTINLVTKDFEKIKNLKLNCKKKDIESDKDLKSDKDLESDKSEQVNSIKFELHIIELIRYLIAKKWNLEDSFSKVEHFDYDDIQTLKINFLNNLIENCWKLQHKDWYANFVRIKNENINRLTYLIKFLEVNRNLVHEVLVNWQISNTNSRMYS